MTAELAAAYRDLRTRILDPTADLAPAVSEGMVPCTPAWSIRDLMCHLAGVPADILTGNTEGAATEAWADGHVTGRAGRSLDEVRAELADVGAQVEEVIGAFADQFPPQFYLDAWTHEADLCHALGVPAPDDTRMVDGTLDFLVDNVSGRLAEAGVGPMRLVGVGDDRVIGAEAGPAAESVEASLTTDVFEFVRVVMGRRSPRQLAALDWDGVDGAVAGPLLVAWTPNDVDIVETVEGRS